MPACFWQPSLHIAGFQAILALLAALAWLTAGVPAWSKDAVLLLITGQLAVWWWQANKMDHPGYRKGLRHTAGEGWQLWSAATGWQAIKILPDTVVTSTLVVLRYRSAVTGRTGSLLVPATVLKHDAHRRLRLWLRLMPLAADKAVE